MKYTNITGAEAITLALIEENIQVIFGYPGGANLPIYDSFYNHEDKISHILVRHEQGAVHAAEGYAEASGHVGVCMATSGPGATNFLTGIADAMLDSVPIVCITGQVNSNELGYDAFQETDVVGFSMPVTKWNYQITNADEIAENIAKAFYIARSGRPGPVLLDITKNAQTSIIKEFEYKKCTKIDSYHPKWKPRLDKIEGAVNLLNNAKRPFMVVGHGVLQSKCREEIRYIAETLSMPVGCTLKGLTAFASDHPLFAGMVGLHGNYAANMLTNECDVLLAVGMRFADRVTGNVKKYAKKARIIHIDIDSSEINKVIQSRIPINSDAKSALKLINEKILPKNNPEWLNLMETYKQKEYEKVIKQDLDQHSKELRMGRVVDAVSKRLPMGAVCVTDVGQNQMAAARYFRHTISDCLITSGGLGTMGFALPAAIGAAQAIKGCNIITFMGDGGFQMTIEELGTIMQYHLPIKIILLNNNYLGMIRQLQELYYKDHDYFEGLINPDFVMIAKAYHIPAKKVTTQEDLNLAIEEMLTTPGPFFIEAQVEKKANIYPVIPAGCGVGEQKLE
ncbi:MAG: biosynthetic-type acetolactate synthase large subunit [Bacteroidales bacterium]|nr:biosynthetic-type acetolactate synthase large subunit [Bacteroidales bacterium]